VVLATRPTERAIAIFKFLSDSDARKDLAADCLERLKVVPSIPVMDVLDTPIRNRFLMSAVEAITPSKLAYQIEKHRR
jgi:hypothetical protein